MGLPLLRSIEYFLAQIARYYGLLKIHGLFPIQYTLYGHSIPMDILPFWTFSDSSNWYGHFITMDNLPYGFFTHRFSGKKACETFWVFMFHLFQPASFYQFSSFNNIQIKKDKQNQIMQDVFIRGLPDSLRWFMDGFFHRVR